MIKRESNAFIPLSQALNDAKRELRYLLVYLHGDDHQDTDEFCRYSNCFKVCYLNIKNLRLKETKNESGF